MLTGNQLKEHTLNRLGYGMGAWHAGRYDQIGHNAYVTEQFGETFSTNFVTAPWPLDGVYIRDKVERSVRAFRQLEAVLLDFWFNHFNVDSGSHIPTQRVKTLVGRAIPHHQNVAILPHLLGDFGEMLRATAESTAMLDYLDNRHSAVNAVNENYARELMELHTLGVNGGYSEADVAEVARIFTGWRVNGQEAFHFVNAVHDHGAKMVMAVPYPATATAAEGYQEGVDFLAFLADHASTAEFICRKLAQRFVSETPPQSLVDNLAAVYLANDRSIKAVLVAMFASPEFADEANFRSKAKPPHRFYASAAMAMGARTEFQYSNVDPQPGILDAGEIPYSVGPPTGYPEVSAFWVSGTAMTERFEVAYRLAYDEFLRSTLRATTLVDGADEEDTLDALIPRFVPGGISDDTYNAILDHVYANASAVSDDEVISATAHMLLCSPEFARY